MLTGYRRLLGGLFSTLGIITVAEAFGRGIAIGFAGGNTQFQFYEDPIPVWKHFSS
jgi:hypothetical protein